MIGSTRLVRGATVIENETDPAERVRMQDALRKGTEGLHTLLSQMLRQEARLR